MNSANDPSVPSSAAPEYEFVKLLGRGGMAEVYLAHKFAPGGAFKEVAFKRILPQFTSDPMRVAKFMDEIATAAALVHPNIVGVHHWGNYEGDYFIEMECVRGITLMEYIRAHAGSTDGEEDELYGPIPPVDVALIGAMMAEGLHYAHTFERGIVTGFVHRDVSPDNVMLDLRGVAKILDYGIAKALKGADRVASKTQTAAGKPYYHPPEQWRGDEVDARTDLYALGTTLGLALCGRQLFATSRKETFESIVYRVFQGDRPPIATIAPPGAPAELVAMLEQLVQADREYRPRTAKELIRPFKEIVRGLAGDLDTAREHLAARIKEHYKGDSDTHKALEPPQFSTANVPSRSTRRPIDPATRADRPGGAPSAASGTVSLEGQPSEEGSVARTAELPAGAQPPVYQASVGGGSSPAYEPVAHAATARPVLLIALGGAVALLVVLGAAAGFVFGGAFIVDGESGATTDTSIEPPVGADPAATPQPTAEPSAGPSAPSPTTGVPETEEAPAETSADDARADAVEGVEEPEQLAPVEEPPETEPAAARGARPTRQRVRRPPPEPRRLGDRPARRRSGRAAPTSGAYGL